MKKIVPGTLQKKLLNWYDRFGRKDLPWQKNKSPYRVWVSEIMLQQTQVNTVIAFFQRFMKQFPTIESLALASEDEVLHLWTGLGYYQRARNLHKTAKIIVQSFKGAFPATLNELMMLPGIGKSTAGAIAAIAFSEKAAILDGNVKRVLVRLQGIRGWAGEKAIAAALWQLAETLTPKKRVADYTQAIMDLGATVCTLRKPRCHECPLINHCSAYHHDLQHTLPIARPSKKIPVRTAIFLIIQKKGAVLLEKRASEGVWAKLWSLPQMGLAEDDAGLIKPSDGEIKTFCHETFNFSIGKIQYDGPFRHTFSHFHLDILPVFITVRSSSRARMESDKLQWYNLKNPPRIGLPQPVKLLLEKLS